jgi:hypothetical protein
MKRTTDNVKRRPSLTVLFCLTLLLGLTPLFAEDPPKQTLADAAKAARVSRKKSKSRVITNADVKKAKGTLIERPETPLPETSGTTTVTVEEHNAHLRALHESDEKLAAARKKTAALEKELQRIEQLYYEENDPNQRDTVVKPRFEQTRRQLDAAQRELSDLRDAHDALERVGKPPAVEPKADTPKS